MEVDELPPVDPNVDYREIYPIHQKRTIAFINHFIMNTVSFLNEFSKSCESRLMEFDYKIQKVEASLLILESQLSSINGLTADNQSALEEIHDDKLEQTLDLPAVVDKGETESDTSSNLTKEEPVRKGPRALEDSRFKKFFKMVQFGVPPQAVKLKMESEGIDSSILDKPDDVIPGHELSTAETNSTNSDSS